MKPLTRVTKPTIDVLNALLDAREPVWGLRIVKATGRPPGSVYPILARLEELGWLTGQWESDSSRNGPRRRLYRLTEDGAVAAQRLATSRQEHRPPLVRPATMGVTA